MAAACARDNIKVDGVETIQGTIADFDVVSRVELNGNTQTVWNGFARNDVAVEFFRHCEEDIVRRGNLMQL